MFVPFLYFPVFCSNCCRILRSMEMKQSIGLKWVSLPKSDILFFFHMLLFHPPENRKSKICPLIRTCTWAHVQGVRIIRFSDGFRGIKREYWQPILESKSMLAIFQKKGKKVQNIWKLGKDVQNLKWFETGQVIACDYRTQWTTRIGLDWEETF